MNAQIPAEFRSPHTLAARPAPTDVLLALSGGADSRLLLELLSRDAREHGYVLHLAHVNHGIRGEEATRDEQFCRDLAQRYGCPFYLLRADVPALAQERGESLEMTARHVRYEYFSALMQEHGISLLATAHHADDNLETVLLRLCRGTSAAGLSGIAPARPFGNGHLVRPLLGMTRAEILSLCATWNLTYVTDSTNTDTAYARNLVRLQVTPALEQISHLPQRQVARSCTLLREDDALLYDMAQTALDGSRTPDGALSLPALRQSPLPILRRVLVLWLRENEILSPQGCHVDALLHLIDSTTCAATDLPGNHRATTDGHTLRLSDKQEQPSPVLPPDQIFPLLDGVTDYAALGFRTELCPSDAQSQRKQQNVYKPFIHEAITFDTIDATAHWRARREGDVLLMGGIHRKIRKLQNAAHIPAPLRERIPLLCDAHGVLWVPFVGTRDGATLDGGGYRLTLEIQSDGE